MQGTIDWTKLDTAEMKFARAKEAKKQQIASARYAAECAGCEWAKDGQTYTVATDRDSRAMLQAAREVAQNVPGFVSSAWKMASGEFVCLTIADMTEIGLAMGAHVQASFDREAELLPLVEAAATQADLDAITWEVTNNADNS